MAKNYRELIAWQKAIDLVEMVYAVGRSFPHEEIYGLTSQIRRAAVSIPSNIAEGEGRNSGKEFARFLSIAHGSLREMETQLIIAERLHYIAAGKLQPIIEQCNEVGRLINGLIRHLKSNE